MRSMREWLSMYGESHQNSTNKLIHWVCVPVIMFSIFGLIYSLPVVGAKTLWSNWAMIGLIITLIFYARLSFAHFVGFAIIGFLMVYFNHRLAMSGVPLVSFSLFIFVVAWIGQFVGHKIEGAKPSFFEDIQFLLIGPAWLLSFVYDKIGVDY